MANIKYAVYLDADNVVNWSIDDMFQMARKYKLPYPLLPRHSLNPESDLSKSMQKLGVVNRSLPYGHASTFVYSYLAQEFFVETYEQVMAGVFTDCYWTDECALNVMLWRREAKYQACPYDMFWDYAMEVYAAQSNLSSFPKNYKELGDIGIDTPIAISTVHGHKEVKWAEYFFAEFKKHRNNKPYFGGNGEEWTNDLMNGTRGCLCGLAQRCQETYNEADVHYLR